MSYLPYICLSLPLVVLRRVYVLFTLFVFACASWCLANIVLCISSYCVL